MSVRNAPTSSKDLILMYSKSRVIVASTKRFVIGHQRYADGSVVTGLDGNPVAIFSRPLSDSDVVRMVARKFS